MNQLRMALLVVALSAGAAHATTAGKTVILLSGPTQDRLINGFDSQFTAAMERAGVKVTLLTSPFDPALQAQQIDDAIGRRPDMIVVQPLSSKAILPAMMRAKGAGIPTFLAIAPLEGDPGLYVGAAGLDDTKSGALAAEALIAGLKRSGRTHAKVAAITGLLAEGIAPVRLAGFKQRLAAENWIELMQVEDAQWNPKLSEQIAGQLFARYAADGGLDGVYGMNDAQANAIIQAADSAGMTLGTGASDLVVVGGGCQESGIRNIKSGKQYATLSGPLPSFDGPAAAKSVLASLGGTPFPHLVTTPLEIIDKSNVATWAAACSF